MIHPELIKTADDITESAYTLLSDIPNANHKGRNIVNYVQVHPGSLKWDWSHACQTVLNYGGYNECDRLMTLIKPNEIIIVDLRLA